MTCDNQWSIQFQNIDGEDGFFPKYMPFEMNLQLERHSFSYFEGQFHPQVGEQLKPETKDEDGKLYGQIAVDVICDGNTVETMLFTPNNIKYSGDSTHIRLEDVQKTLKSGIVDKQWDSVKIKDAYEYAFNQSPQDILNGIKFTLPDRIEGITFVSEQQVAREAPSGVGRSIVQGAQEQAETNQRVVEGNSAVEFDSISPLKAIWQLNNNYNLQSWVSGDEYLWVGVPETNGSVHFAAPDDRRVWRYSNVSINHPREPIKEVVLKGSWVDQPGTNIDLEDATDWLNPFGGGKTEDLRVAGVARRPDIDFGVTLELTSPDPKKDTVEHVAELGMLEAMKEHNSGTVEIEPQLSGNSRYLKTVKPGSFLHVVPNDNHISGEPTADSGEIGEIDEFNSEVCGAPVYNELYLIQGVQHRVKEGRWKVILDVGLWPYDIVEQIESQMMYFNPDADDPNNALIPKGEAKSFLIEDY